MDGHPLQLAVWMCQDLGVLPPPVPDIWADALEEWSVGEMVATHPDLLELKGPADLAHALARAWPVPGLAFGLTGGGVNRRWFYTLVSEKIIVNIDLVYNALPGEAATSAAFVSMAHARLERHLADEASYFRAINLQPGERGESRRIVSYTHEAGVTCEKHASWRDDQRALVFTPRDEIFAEDPASPPPDTGDFVVVRA